MQILVNNKPAAIAKGTSFELNLRSSYFQNDESFSLNIDFPLDIKENRAIFGPASGFDYMKDQTFVCSIIVESFVKTGFLQILSVHNKTVSAQFVEGFSSNIENNVGTDTYIDEMQLGTPTQIIRTQSGIQYDLLREIHDELYIGGVSYVKDGVTYNHTQNLLEDYGFQAFKFQVDGTVYNDSFYNSQSFGCRCYPMLQIYYRKLLSLVCGKLGYTITQYPSIYQFNQLLVANTYFSGWNLEEDLEEPDISKSLPHWTFLEFINYTAKLFGHSYTIDNNRKTIQFKTLCKRVYDYSGTRSIVKLNRNEIRDDYQIDTLDEYPSYLGNESYSLKLYGNNEGVGDCANYLAKMKEIASVVEYSESDFLDWVEYWAEHGMWGEQTQNNIYNIDVEEYGYHILMDSILKWTYNSETYNFVAKFYPLDQFPRQSDNVVELPFSPVSIVNDEAYPFTSAVDARKVAFELDEFIAHGNSTMYESFVNGKILYDLFKDHDESTSTYSKLFLCFFTMKDPSNTDFINRKVPTVATFEIRNKTTYHSSDYGTYSREYPCEIVWNSAFIYMEEWQGYDVKSILNSKKYTIHVINDKIYDVNSLFEIEGELYICANIKLSISTDGISYDKELELYKVSEYNAAIEEAETRSAARRGIRPSSSDSGSASGSGSGSGDIAE